MVSLSAMLRKFTSDSYYNIVEIFMLSLIYSTLILPCVFIEHIQFQVVYASTLLFPSFFGIMYALNNKLMSGYKIHYKDVFSGTKKYYLKSIVLAIILNFFTITLYSSYLYLKNTQNLFSFTSFALQVFVLVMVLLILMYTIPLILKEDVGIKEGLKQGMKILSDNIFYSIGALIQIISIIILLLLTVVGIPLVFCGLLCIFLLSNYNNVIKKYI